MNYIYGGIAIGLGISILLIINGRILGISGIFREFLKNPLAEMGWRFFFLLGLVMSPFIYSKFINVKDFEIHSNPFVIIIGGLLIGIGATLSNGCTSGHAVCGVSRLSKRSFVASFVMIVSAILTYNIVQFI